MSEDEPCPQCGSQVWDLVLTECCGVYMCEACKDAHDEKWHIPDEPVADGVALDGKRQTCPECGNSYYPNEVPRDCLAERCPYGVKASAAASAWWALVMGAAASIEDAANCLHDPDAKKQADGAAKHYREAAQKLMAAAGVKEDRNG